MRAWFHGIISDFPHMIKPTLVVLDAARVMMRNGPTGGSLSDVYDGDTIIASTDSLAADAFGWDDLLRRQGQEKPGYFASAAAKGLGNMDWRAVTRKEVQVG